MPSKEYHEITGKKPTFLFLFWSASCCGHFNSVLHNYVTPLEDNFVAAPEWTKGIRVASQKTKLSGWIPADYTVFLKNA